MSWPVDDGVTQSTESITFDYNESASGAETALVAHSLITADNINVKGGSFPHGALYVVYLSAENLNRNQDLPTTTTNSLTGGTSPRFEYSYITLVDWNA
jgi:hypothetical protein